LQRNAALRRAHLGLSSRDAVAPWTAAVVRLGTELDHQRARLVELLGERVEACAALLGLARLTLRYVPSEVSAETLERLLPRDLERGTTGAGPHLAELELTAADRDLRTLGSQGEQRLAVLALLLAEAGALIATRGDTPMLLLDDVLSELDDRRREALLCGIPPDCQTIVTTTSLRMLPPAGPDPSAVVEISPGRAEVR
jgi:DNA replication and repair protein RecF